MKRSLTLMRVLLLSYGGYELPTKLNASKAEYAYHQRLLVSAGYKMRYYDHDDEPCFRLTHAGQEAVALVANKDLWDAVQKQARDAGAVSVPFELLLELMRELLKKRLMEQGV